MTGFITLHRKFTEWEWYTDINTKVLFLHCLLKANHKEKKWRGNTIKRGQFITGTPSLSKETGLSVKQIRTALNKLKKTGEIDRQSGSQYSIITICKYDTYQDIENIKGRQSGSQEAVKRQKTGSQEATTNNDNNDNNYNIDNKKEKLKQKEIFENKKTTVVDFDKFSLKRDKTYFEEQYSDNENLKLLGIIEDTLLQPGEKYEGLLKATSLDRIATAEERNRKTQKFVIQFLRELHGKRDFYKSEREIRSHCVNWINKKHRE